MRFDKLTLKSQELIGNAQTLAANHNHQTIEPEHLFYSMLNEKNSVAGSVLAGIGISTDSLTGKLQDSLNRMPKVTGSGTGQVSLSGASTQIIESAFKEADNMKDEYELQLPIDCPVK